MKGIRLAVDYGTSSTVAVLAVDGARRSRCATPRQVAREAYRLAGRAVDELTMTCPVEWGPARRAVLTGAAAAVGLPAPTLVAEPVAASTYFAAC